MTRMRVFMVLVLALTAGGGLAFATYNYVQNAPTRTVTIPTRPVVVAATDLQIGAALDAKSVRVIDWPSSAVPKNAIADPQEVIGRGLLMPVLENEPILPTTLASKEAGAGLPPAIPPGLRALSVRVNEVIGVAGYVLPGTHVDVVATVNPGEKQGDTTSKVILTNVLVLAAGTKMEQDVNNKPMAVNVVTLLVNPDESERLTLAAGEGKIQLALRNPLDKESPITHGVRPAALLGTTPVVRVAAAAPHAASAPPPPPPVVQPPAMVEIIRGDKRAQEVVRQEQ
jgi:pilus assembly protein CpaB